MPWDFWLIFLALGVLVPWRGRQRLKRFLSLPETSSRERIALYLSTIVFQWIAVALVLWRCGSRGVNWTELGLTAEPARLLTVVAIVGALTMGLLHWFNLRRIGRMQAATAARTLLQTMARRVLPQSRSELALFFVLAVTAGVCEEILYRGFVIAALDRAGLAAWALVLVSAALFGLAHLYQGRSGIAGTLLLGTVFSVARLAYHSLLPIMVWHATIDAVAGIAGPKHLMARREA